LFLRGNLDNFIGCRLMLKCFYLCRLGRILHSLTGNDRRCLIPIDAPLRLNLGGNKLIFQVSDSPSEIARKFPGGIPGYS